MKKIQPYNYKNTLRHHRSRSGLLQSQVAKELGLVGIDRISYWEHGTAIPSLPNLFKLCLLYQATPFDLYPDLIDTLTKERENRHFER